MACEAKETSEAIAEVLGGDSERVLAFSCPEGDDTWELQAMQCGKKRFQINGEDVKIQQCFEILPLPGRKVQIGWSLTCCPEQTLWRSGA